MGKRRVRQDSFLPLSPLSFQTCVGVADPGKEKKSRGQKDVIPLSLTLELPFFRSGNFVFPSFPILWEFFPLRIGLFTYYTLMLFVLFPFPECTTEWLFLTDSRRPAHMSDEACTLRKIRKKKEKGKRGASIELSTCGKLS